MDDHFDYIMGTLAAIFLVLFFGLIGFAVYQDAHFAHECIESGHKYVGGSCQ